MLTKAVGLRETSRNAETIRQAMPVDASGNQGQSRGVPSPTPFRRRAPRKNRQGKSVSTKAVGLRETSRNAETIRQATPVNESGTQGQSRGVPSPTPLNPHPSQVPPAAQFRNTSACGDLEPRRGHWSASTGGFRRRSPPDVRRGIRRCWGGGHEY